MIAPHLYEAIRDKYGKVASWAVWEQAGEKPKSNMGPQNIFDLKKNKSLLKTLRHDVVMVALNFSRDVSRDDKWKPFSNFHPEHPHAHDYKIRHAFEGTAYYGAYMTDKQDVRAKLAGIPTNVNDRGGMFGFA